ncbi:prostaglandin G/H synthase 2-like [Styela clava]
MERSIGYKVLFAVLFVLIAAAYAEQKYDPCCSLPCENNGICYTKGFDDYECDCTRTGHYGKNCEIAPFSTWLKKFIKPTPATIQYIVTHYETFWKIVNSIPWLQKTFMAAVLKLRIGLVEEPSAYIANDDYTTWDTYVNRSVYARTLPPVPRNCPTPMGVAGKKELPPAELVAEKLFTRKKFRPCPQRSSVVFPLFAQHLNHQYFKTDFRKGYPFYWGSHYADLSNVYGHTIKRQHALRSFVDGKMKTSIINGEVYPPLEADAVGAEMVGAAAIPEKYRVSVGHPYFGALPFFMIWATVYLREHNRVCDILKVEHPEWDDEQLFQTARLVITGETIKIVVEEYVQHLSGFHFKLIYDPEIVMGQLSYHNQIHQEFHAIYHWHPMIPDYLEVRGKHYKIRELLFNPKPFVEAGLGNLLSDLHKQFSGRWAGGQNHGSGTLVVGVQTIMQGRVMRLQSFNKYRKRFNLPPYKSFEEFTGEKEMAAELEELYGDIDALEFYVGLVLEKRRDRQLFGETLATMGAPYSLKGLYGSPLASPGWWKPSTFGGEVGFNIVKEASLQKMVCDNVEGCPTVGFTVPDDVEYKEDEFNTVPVPDDDTADIMVKLSHQAKKAYQSTQQQTCDKSKNDCGKI